MERAIIGRKFRHGGHPVLHWNFENIAVETDQAGNKSFHKGKSRDRIDGAVVSAMAGAAHRQAIIRDRFTATLKKDPPAYSSSDQ